MNRPRRRRGSPRPAASSSHLSESRGEVRDFEVTRASLSGVDHDVDGGITAAGVALGSSPDGFHTVGTHPDGYSSAIVGDRDPLITAPDITSDSNRQAGGVGIA